MSLTATAGLLTGLPRDVAGRLPVASLRERLEAARQPTLLRWILGQPQEPHLAQSEKEIR